MRILLSILTLFYFNLAQAENSMNPDLVGLWCGEQIEGYYCDSNPELHLYSNGRFKRILECNDGQTGGYVPVGSYISNENSITYDTDSSEILVQETYTLENDVLITTRTSDFGAVTKVRYTRCEHMMM